MCITVANVIPTSGDYFFIDCYYYDMSSTATTTANPTAAICKCVVILLAARGDAGCRVRPESPSPGACTHLCLLSASVLSLSVFLRGGLSLSLSVSLCLAFPFYVSFWQAGMSEHVGPA